MLANETLRALPRKAEGKGSPAAIPIRRSLLFANSIIVALGAIVGTWLTKQAVEYGVFSPLTFFFFVLGGTMLSILVNRQLIKVALTPLANLQQTVEEVQKGNLDARASCGKKGDPSVARLAMTLNAMLERIVEHNRLLGEERKKSQSLAKQIIVAQEEERKRISRELHDETSQALTGLIIGLEGAEKALPSVCSDCRGCRDKILYAKKMAIRALEETHRIAIHLRPTILDDLGLVAAIHWFSSDQEEQLGIPFDYAVTGNRTRFPSEVETALFRIVQEAATNIAKHSNASRAYIRLAFDDDSASLSVEDDGKGFDESRLTSSETTDQRLGLFGMKERAALIGGAFAIRSAPGSGVRIEVKVPVKTTIHHHLPLW
ncbi:MAG: sensor histidine kinase [Armatimonadetes bacterium]|nr:sensor histidine kinase [Armatimonadota bacterium]